MIALDQWHVVADSAEVRPGKPLKLRRFSKDLVFWRDSAGKVQCIADKCVHRGASLALGKVKGDCIACPFHAFEFRGDGSCARMPVNGEGGVVPKAMRGAAEVVCEEKGWIWLWNGAPRESYPEVPWFEQIDSSYLYHTFQDLWPVHVTRAVENQLDMFHLPYVHVGTIGSFAKPEAEPMVQLVGRRMKFWNAKFTGPAEPESFYLEFYAPNIWINSLGKGFFVMAAFVAVDDGSSITYLRTYQNKVTWPVVGQLLCWFNTQLNKIILGQDRRVVVSQLPIRTELRMDEVLVPADRPIIEYRRMIEADARLRAQQAEAPAEP